MLEREINEIDTHLQPFIDNFGATEETSLLLDEIVTAEDYNNKYEQFWYIWNKLYPKFSEICNGSNQLYLDKVTISYLLAWRWWRDGIEEWHSLQKGKLSFYANIAKDSGHNPAVLYSIVRVLNTIGSKFVKEGIDWIHTIVSNNTSLKIGDLESNTLYYLESYIANNTWTVEGSKTIGNNENGVVSIIIPKGFHAKKAVMKLTAGNILVSGLSADNTKVEVGMGKCEIKNMYSQHLNMKCGMGDIVGSCSMNGDVNVDCGMGNVTLTLTNSADNFNMSATAGMGCVDIGGTKIHGAGSKLDNNIGALHNINVKCGMGNVKIGFNERDEA